MSLCILNADPYKFCCNIISEIFDDSLWMSLFYLLMSLIESQVIKLDCLMPGKKYNMPTFLDKCVL